MIFINDEYKGTPWWFPRRPSVAVPDIIAALFASLGFTYTQGLDQIYFVAAAAVFIASAIHHWLPWARWHYIVDRCLIFGLIVATPLLVFEFVITNENPIFLWLYVFGVVIAMLGVYGVVSGRLLYKGHLPTLAYAIPFVLGILVMYPAQFSQTVGYVLLWLGVALYALQSQIYNQGWPSRAWCRTMQHIVLYGAFCLHSLIPLLGL